MTKIGSAPYKKIGACAYGVAFSGTFDLTMRILVPKSKMATSGHVWRTEQYWLSHLGLNVFFKVKLSLALKVDIQLVSNFLVNFY